MVSFFTQDLSSYDKNRDVLFIFGVGASVAEGAPLQGDLLRQILNSKDDKLSNSESVKTVASFIGDNFDLSGGRYPSMESVFGYIDYFILKNEGLGPNYSTAEINEIREALIILIHYVTASGPRDKKGTYRKFWELVSSRNRNVSIVTMNYDTLLDESFDFLYPDKSYIDYCIDLMNYHQLPDNDRFNWWDDPRKPVPVWKGGDPKPIKIIKIHGSLNWKYCNCCNQVLHTPWDTEIDLGTMGFKGYIYPNCENPKTLEFTLLCPFDGNKFNTFIVPPSHVKNLFHPIINKLLDEAACEIRKAKQIVFVGYSFPESDVHIKALLKKNLSKNKILHIVNPDLNELTRANYKCLSDEVLFYKQTFDEYINIELASIL